MTDKVYLQIDKDLLVGTIFYPDKKGKHKAVVFLNGMGGTKERFYSIAEALLAKGYVSFCFDFRGRGESVTKTTPPFRHQLEDAKKVIDYVASLPYVDKNNLTLIGTSMGGYVSASVANYHKGIKRIYLFEPSLLLPDTETLPYLEITADDVEIALKGNLQIVRPLQEISKFKGELYLIIHNESSILELTKQIVPIYYKNGAKAKKREKLSIKGARHAIFKTKEGQKKAEVFLMEKL